MVYHPKADFVRFQSVYACAKCLLVYIQVFNNIEYLHMNTPNKKAAGDADEVGYRREQLRLEGEGAKLKLIEIAQGQKAQIEVLGEDKVLQLQMLKELLAVAGETPEFNW